MIAEVRGPQPEIEAGVRAISGVQAMESSSHNGWVRVNVEPHPDRDVREDIFHLTSSKGWPLRELRREGATLEDFFVQVTAQQAQRASTG